MKENTTKNNFLCGHNTLTEAVPVNHLSNNVGISDEFCGLSQTAISWAFSGVWQIAVSWALRGYVYPLLLLFHVWPSNQTLIMGVTIWHASIFKQYFLSTHCRLLWTGTNKLLGVLPNLFRFGSVWGGAKSAGNCVSSYECRREMRMVCSLWTKTRLFAVPYHIVYRSSSAFIKIKNQN